MTVEQWRPVPGYEGAYEVSDLGRVRSLDRISSHGRRLKGRILKQILRAGYLSVGLHLGGDATLHLVHRLVLTAFTRPPADGMQARHLDGDASNNAASNLAWGTCQENIRDQLRHGTQRNLRKTHCPKDHPYSEGNLYVDPSGSRVCRKCKRESLARWKAENPERFREIHRRATQKYDAKRRSKKVA